MGSMRSKQADVEATWKIDPETTVRLPTYRELLLIWFYFIDNHQDNVQSIDVLGEGTELHGWVCDEDSPGKHKNFCSISAAYMLMHFIIGFARTSLPKSAGWLADDAVN